MGVFFRVSAFLHWLVGFAYMHYVSGFINILRGILRRGVLWVCCFYCIFYAPSLTFVTLSSSETPATLSLILFGKCSCARYSLICAAWSS